MDIKQWYDRVFGNNDGKFTLADLPSKSVGIVALVVDLLMLLAEYRVGAVGYHLTGNILLALGFVAVSSIPFYLGQLAWLYNRANGYQQWIAGGMVGMGLAVSAYYGFADYLLTNTIYVTNSLSVSIDTTSLFAVAVGGTAVLILAGLLYVIIDDGVANERKAKKIQGRFDNAKKEMEMKTRLLDEAKKVRLAEESLANAYGEDYAALQEQFVASANRTNPTNGNGNMR